jgi:4-hydroxy-3-methylbut-2-en-1-yl diphosphate reductase
VRVAAPLRVEALAARAAVLRTVPAGPVLLTGTAGAVVDLAPGDLVVADRVLLPDGAEVGLPDPAELVRDLRARGLTVHQGPLGGADRLVTGAARAPWAARGALAVDLESGTLARAGRLVAVVRAVVDTPTHPLVHPGTVPRGIAALRSLRRAAPTLAARSAAGTLQGETP